jgi:hypothetical protein
VAASHSGSVMASPQILVQAHLYAQGGQRQAPADHRKPGRPPST